jgi:putative ABC transport system substrate-binding protein
MSLGLVHCSSATIPVVALTTDPVAQGLAADLARPGGNFTDVSVDTGPSIHGKRIALLREMYPKLGSVAFITLRGAWEGALGSRCPRGRKCCRVESSRSWSTFRPRKTTYLDLIAKIRPGGADAVMIGDSPDVMAKRAVIAAQIASAALPAIYTLAEFVDAA